MSKLNEFAVNYLKGLNEEKNKCNERINSLSLEKEEINKKIEILRLEDKKPEAAFLPEGAEDSFRKDEINMLSDKVNENVKYIDILKLDVDKLDEKINLVEEAINEDREYDDLHSAYITDNKSYISKINLIRKFVKQDPTRADQELLYLKKNIQNNINSFKKNEK